MAHFHKGLKYHEDTIEKHKITVEEITFLKELQKEMNTQDNVGQAAPRFWVIKGTEKVHGIEDGYQDDSELIDEDSCTTVAADLKEAVEYINENILDEINEFDGIKRTITYCERLGLMFPEKVATITWIEDGEEESLEYDNMSDLVDWLNVYGYSFRVANYCNKGIVYKNTMFLTQKDAADHLEKNDYHYSENAHTYAMTAWRSPRVEKLFKILEEVDWDSLIQKGE